MGFHQVWKECILDYPWIDRLVFYLDCGVGCPVLFSRLILVCVYRCLWLSNSYLSGGWLSFILNTNGSYVFKTFYLFFFLFFSITYFMNGWKLWFGVWVNRVSIPATGRYCLATLMSSDRTKQISLWMTIEIYNHLTPWGWVLKRRSTRVAISVYCKPLRRWIEVLATVERMYVNNINCDS